MRRISKRIYVSVAILMIVAIVFTTIHFNRVSAEADGYVTLPGIETIILNNNSGNPFVIVEVVADKNDASLGYLIKGEEPLKEGKALSDMPSFDERKMAINDFMNTSVTNSKVNSLVSKGAITLPAGEYAEYDVNEPNTNYGIAAGYFYQDSAEGDYMLKTPKNAYRKYIPEADAGKNRFTRYLDVDFTGSSKVSLNFKYLENATDKRVTYHGEDYNMYFVYNVKSKVTLDTDGLDLSKYINKPVYYITVNANAFPIYNYYGIMQSDGTIKITSGEFIDSEDIAKDRYAFVEFEATTLGGEYVYSDVTDVSGNNGGFGLYSHYEVNNSSGDYVRDENLKETYEYMPAYSPYEMDPDNFDYSGPYSYVHSDDYSYSGEYFFYKNGIVNNDWFRNYVMDIPAEELDSFNIDVKTMTMEEFNAYDVTKASLVYFAAGDYDLDINPSQAQNVISEIRNNKLPVVMDRSFGSNLQNNSKLSTVLRQNNLSISAVDKVLSNWDEKTNWDILYNSVDNTSSFVKGSVYVYDDKVTPFVYGDFLDDFSDMSGYTDVKNEIDTENEYRKVKLGNGTQLVRDNINKATALRYIINFSNQRITTKTNVKVLEIEPCYSFSTYYTEGKGSNNPANDLKDVHVVSYYDTSKNVHNGSTDLTVEKLTRETISADIVRSWINQDNVNGQNGTEVTLVQTYTNEFIGKVEDLNENYDLIYIGLDTTTMNTEVTGVEMTSGRTPSPKNGTGTKTNRTVYNDTKMNGLIYSHYGDLLSTNDSNGSNNSGDFPADILTWQEGYDYAHTFDSNETPLVKNVRNGKAYNYRLSGNDITEEKYNDLIEYINSGYAVVFADNFFIISNNGSNGARTAKVNTAVVAEDSYMYKLGVYAADFLNLNVFVQSDLEENKNDMVLKRFKTWLNISKLQVTPKSVPTPYTNTSGTNPTYLNSNTLTYEVELKNDAAIGVTSTTYDVHLYVDISVDGRFTADEEIANLSVYEGSNKLSSDSNGKFNLYAGRTYTIQRELPAGYVGMLPWKLVFSQNGNSTVRRALSGYTALPITSSARETINVLQITSERKVGNTTFDNKFDLTSDEVKKQLALVQDFDIKITKKNIIDIIDNMGFSSEKDFLDYYNGFDMLILGFQDCFDYSGAVLEKPTKSWNMSDRAYQTALETYREAVAAQKLRNEAASEALADYINSGRSVLFAHDTTSRFNYDYDDTDYDASYGGDYRWGYYFNKYVRTVVGMDRYNVLGGSAKYDYLATDGDTALDNKNAKKKLLTQGYTYIELMKYGQYSGLYPSSRQTIAKATGQAAQGQYVNHNYYVTKVNDGQITEYPFKIPDRIQVRFTHGQYYQLNLDTNSEDDISNDDIVVWYCISDIDSSTYDDAYQAFPNDVRNNYYIYNKGNITYTGVGHEKETISQDGVDYEIRLFINTMVAAYKAGVHPPKVVYHDGNTNAPINTAYVPYDHALGEYLDDEVVLYFEITDSSFVQGERQLEHEFKIIRYNLDGTSQAQANIAAGIYEVNSDGTLGNKKAGELDFDTTYALKLKTEDLKYTDPTKVMPYVSICVRAQTKYKTEGSTIESGWGEYNLDIRRTELFDLK